MAENVLVVKDLPRGASYVFRVGVVTQQGAGSFSDPSLPVVMATHPEGKSADPSPRPLGGLGTDPSVHLHTNNNNR